MSEIKSPWAKKDKLLDKNKEGKPVSTNSLDASYSAWKAKPTPANAGKVLGELKSDIDASLRNYGGSAAETLRTQANLVALKALEDYDEEKGASKRTHVRNSLHKLTRIRNERSNVMHIPENVQMERAHLNQVQEEFMAEFDREPNLHELADRSKFSPKQIQRIRQYKPTSAQSRSTGEEGDLLLKGDNKRSAYDMWLDYVYFELDPIDKKVYEYSTGYGGSEKLSKGDIAKKLKISAPAVSKRINKILAKIEEGEELNA